MAHEGKHEPRFSRETRDTAGLRRDEPDHWNAAKRDDLPRAGASRTKQLQVTAASKRIQQQFGTGPVRLRDSSTERAPLPPLPGLAKGPGIGALISFTAVVIAPVLFASIYFFSYVSPQYVSEFRFSVKDTATTSGASPSLLSAISGSAMGIVTENYMVADYLTSRQAVEDLQKKFPVIALYARPEIDSLSRFDDTQPMESFIAYWQKMTSARYDQVSGIVTAKIHAFTPEDSFKIASALVDLSEELVNDIARRTRADAVRFAESEVDRAKERVRRVRTTLTDKGGTNVSDAANASMLLDVERQIAQNILASSMQTLDQARSNAAAKHLYITPYMRPSLPQSSTYPRPFVSIAVVAAIAFGIWLSGLLIVRSIFDRFH